MGTVWRAFDKLLEAEVALKEIEFAGGVPDEERADRVERALREAKHAAKLRAHPHVVTILDVVLEDGLPWIVMELVQSRSLFDVIRQDGPLPPAEVARVGLAMVDALSAAGEFGVIHRDVKPSNVLMAHDGRVVLTDFGIATGDGDPTLTVTGVIGTPLYMAPERLNNEPATLEADLFSLGGTLYFAVEGQAPFARESFSAMLAAIVLAPAPPPRNAGPITAALLGLLEKDPKTRMRPAAARQIFLDTIRAVDPSYVDVDATATTPRRLRGTTVDVPPSRSDSDASLPPTGRPATGRPEPGRVGTGPAESIRQVREPRETSRDARADSARSQPTESRPLPPAELTALEEDGAIALRWAPSPTPGVVYRVFRLIADPAAPGGWRSRGLGTTGVTELFDAGVPKGVPFRHQVVATFRDATGHSGGGGGTGQEPSPAASTPVSTMPRILVPSVTALRADLDGDAVALSWRPIPGHNRVVIERIFDESSSFQGAMRRFRGSGGQYLDNDVQAGATYRYRVWVAPPVASAMFDPSSCAEVTVTAVPRPRPVTDLESRATLGGTVLRWTTVPGAVVRIYATPVATGSGLSGTGPFGPAGHEVRVGSLEGRARLVGESRRGRFVDNEGGAEVVYTPVSVAGDRAVIGAAVMQT
ncbi:serine/threonine-protein kinase [Pseudofrankia sp. BMG5.37]